MNNNKKNFKTTNKKQKFVKIKKLIDPETGEEYPTQVNVIEDRDFNFHKFWLENFVLSTDGIVNQKMKLAFWIIDNLNKENQLVKTQRAIAEETGLSIQTVNRTMKILCEKSEDKIPFLKKINSGAYMVNPDILYKGSHQNRMAVTFEFYKINEEKNNLK